MLGAAVDLQTGQRVLGDDVAGHHAADSHAHSQLRLLLHQDAVLGLFQTANPTGVGAVVLLLGLLAGQNGLLSVDDDDEVAAVSVRGVLGLVLTAQQNSGGGSSLAQRLAGSIETVPLTLDVTLVCHKGRHIGFPPFMMIFY